MIKVTAPDGSTVSFPAGTSEGVINQVMSENFGPKEAPVTAAGLGKAALSGAVSGTAGMFGLPADLAALVTDSAKAVRDAIGGQGIEKFITDNITGPLHQPGNTAEKVTSGVFGFLPGMAFPPGGATRRLVQNVLAPGLASEAAGAITEDNPYAKAGAAIIGAAGASKVGRSLERATSKLPKPQTAEELADSVGPSYKTPALAGVEFAPEFVNGAYGNPSLAIGQKFNQLRRGGPPVAQAMVDDVTDTLKKSDASLKNADVKAVFDEVAKLRVPENGNTYRINDFENTRRQLSMLANSGSNEGRRAAVIAMDSIDAGLGKLIKTPGAVLAGDGGQAFKDLMVARDTAAANFRSQRIEQYLQNALIQAQTTNSGGNLENLIYQQIRADLKKPDQRLKGWTAQEKEALMAVLPGASERLLRRVGNYLGGGGGLGQLGASYVAGHAFGPIGPPLAIAAGTGAKAYAASRAKTKLEGVAELLRARAPAYAPNYQQYLDLQKQIAALPPAEKQAILAALAIQPTKQEQQ